MYAKTRGKAAPEQRSLSDAVRLIREQAAQAGREVSFVVEKLFAAGFWDELSPAAQEAAGKIGLIKRANDLEHQVRPNKVSTITHSKTRVDGTPVRRFSRPGVSGQQTLQEGLWGLTYIVRGVRKSVMEFTQADWRWCYDDSRAKMRGFAENCQTFKLGMKLLVEHNVDRTDKLPKTALRQLGRACLKGFVE